jgi:ParB/RepB/Spo0J family partition protein
MKKSALSGLKSFNPDERYSQAMPNMNLLVPVGQESTFAKIPLRLISPNPAQPRRHYSDERLQELVRSIKERGVLQPIRVAEIAAGEYQIIAGERRFRATALAGLGEIPAVIVRGQLAEQSYIDAVVENLLRENLNALDRASALSRIKDSLGGGFRLSFKDACSKSIGTKMRLSGIWTFAAARALAFKARGQPLRAPAGRRKSPHSVAGGGV